MIWTAGPIQPSALEGPKKLIDFVTRVATDHCSKHTNTSLEQELTYIFKSQGLDTHTHTHSQKKLYEEKNKNQIELAKTKMVTILTSNRP